jgi:hypothetical protein
VDGDAQLRLVATTSDSASCFKVVVDSFSIARYNNFSDIAKRAGISDIINFRLEQVITPKRVCFSEEVVRAVCTLTTSSWFLLSAFHA